jgi:hypothetical protein
VLQFAGTKGKGHFVQTGTFNEHPSNMLDQGSEMQLKFHQSISSTA